MLQHSPSSTISVPNRPLKDGRPLPTDMGDSNLDSDLFELHEDDVPEDDVPEDKPKKRIRKKKEEKEEVNFQLFEGMVVPAMHGKRNALVYRVPGDDDLCFTFQLHRENKKKPDAYNCVGCRSNKEDSKFVKIEVLDGSFLSDPALLPHVCSPSLYTDVMATRKLYQVTQDLRKDSHGEKPYNAFRKLLVDVHTDPSLLDNEKTAIASAIGPFAKNRKALSTAVNFQKDKFTTMTQIAPELQQTFNREPFLHIQTSSLLIFYSVSRITQAMPFLSALICDGCHSYQPKELGSAGQLYTIHGALSRGNSVPLLHCITGSKSQLNYTKIFKALKSVFDAAGVSTENLPILLDYERAAIQAARKVFGEDSVQGCTFHFTQALNRRRDREGLKKFTDENSDPSVSRWYGRVLALSFLPKDLLDLSDVLLNPVLPRHPAHSACRNFITYFKETWCEGIFSELWNKFQIDEHRTTNTAEAYHRKLDVVFNGVERPPLKDLINHFKTDDLESQQTLLYKIEGVHEKKLRAKDELRRKTITDKMKKFAEAIKDDRPSHDQVKEYLDDMAQHLSRKAFH